MKSGISVFGVVILAACLQLSVQEDPPLIACKAIGCYPTPNCPFGVANDEVGCPTCRCKQCPAIACRPGTICPSGFAKDENGCPSCKCNQPCPVVACKCPYGTIWTTDSNGCETCSCKPKPNECPDVSICHQFIKCANGIAVDENGCETCGCKQPCPVVDCFCLYGTIFSTNSNGCETCSCKPKPNECPDVSVCHQLIKCANGIAIDENGCETCGCNPERACPLIRCSIPCLYGYETDKRGCRTCDCKPKPRCPPLICPAIEKFCPFGVGALDENGCETCECKPAPECPLIKCLPTTDCPHGFATDDRGCQTCDCKPYPGCPRLLCPAVHECPNGRGALDGNGCPTCDCKPLCSRRSCPNKKCPGGYEVDANGCQTCTCKPFQCPLPVCPAVICPDGLGFEFDKDDNGCQINCRCRTKKLCPPFLCRLYCRQKDRFDINLRSCTCGCGEPTRED